jgi:hypothetical protein
VEHSIPTFSSIISREDDSDNLAQLIKKNDCDGARKESFRAPVEAKAIFILQLTSSYAIMPLG